MAFPRLPIFLIRETIFVHRMTLTRLWFIIRPAAALMPIHRTAYYLWKTTFQIRRIASAAFWQTGCLSVKFSRGRLQFRLGWTVLSVRTIMLRRYFMADIPQIPESRSSSLRLIKIGMDFGASNRNTPHRRWIVNPILSLEKPRAS